MASTKPWTPAPGRHQINIGSSLGRALKARKGNPPPQKRSNLPERDFYALRYNFKPSSIDSTKSGNMEVRRNKDGNSSIIVEHPAQPNGYHVYQGREDPAKEWACVLIFDEETGSYTLEKIESFVALDHLERRADSLIAVTSQPTTSNNERSPSQAIEDQEKVAEREIESILEELVDSSRQTKAEPDSEEDIPIKHTLPSRPPPHPPRPTKSATSKAKARPAPSEPPIRSLAAPPAPSNKPKKVSKRTTPEFSDLDEELLDYTRPSPSKRTRLSPPSQPPPPAPISKPPQPKRAPPRKQPSPPPPKPRAALELPGSSSSFIPPPVPSSSSTSRQPPTTVIPPASPLLAVVEPPTQESAVASDSEVSDWDEVDAAPDGVSPMITMIEETGEESENGNVNGNENENDGGEEIDVDAFEELIIEHLGEEGNENGEEDDERFNIFPESPEPQPQELPIPSLQRSGPISLNAFAGGIGDHDDDDEYSSSEESDDDE